MDPNIFHPRVLAARKPAADHGAERNWSLSPTIKLVSLETALPEYILPQAEAAALAASMFSDRNKDFPRLAKVFETTGIHTRYAVRPLDWFRHPHDWRDRTAAYLDGAQKLFVVAARKAIEAAGLEARDIDTIVTVSSTGIATPTLDARAFQDLGFREGTRRVPVFGLGCAGGVSGLSIAASLAASRPGSNVLLVVIELCTLAFRLDKPTKANIVATALFGDGAAACILHAEADGAAQQEGGLAVVEAAGEYTWADTLDIMGWNVDAQGFDVIFSRAIPPFAEARAGTAIAAILARAGLKTSDVDRFVCHPGGAKVITALEQSLALGSGSLDHERDVLAGHGNMSAPTILFVLKRVLHEGLPDRALLSAMGPGFSLSCVSLRRAA